MADSGNQVAVQSGGNAAVAPARRPAVDPIGRSRQRRLKLVQKYVFVGSFLILPMIIFLIFVVSPYVQAFYLALTDWTGYSPTFEFIGLQNFAALFGFGDFNPDRVFWAGLRNNMILLLVVPFISIAIALFFASMLNLSGSTKAGQLRGVTGAAFYRVLFFVPQVVSVAALAIMFQQVFHPGGLLNSLLRLVGVASPPSWLADPNTAMLTVIIVMVWMNVGFYMVYFSAAMSSIPRELLEAAAIDKASRAQTFLRITLPLLRSSIITAYIYLGVLCLDAFAIVQLMTIGPGGPNETTTVMALSIYKSFKEQGQFGYATAQGVVLFLITMVLAALTLRVTRREQGEL
ncbi:carbohydrate ABC transporter permease [Microlunatus parietis]|uniref:N-acetylglucosamine transport system permease protein n=1 Tax=Microlunatus parietis TaxID=682979 RepID=A0A7Y9LFZ7_9ACTN|nr:sugar ABC transporter permease [Microlunatus parietis]NYE75358.1 N-acetylglucosamine transport system permease protein [Microlunatus parietis]